MKQMEHIARLIEGSDEDLYARADDARRRHCGEAVHLRGIIEFSNVCSRNCAYCGLRRDNTSLQRYTMSEEEILMVVARAEESGVRTIVLQSGECDAEQTDRLAGLIRAVKREFDVAITLSVGVKSRRSYRVWRQAGADRYLLKHEAANPDLYAKLHPDSSLDDRLSGLAALRALGYQIGNGSIVGLPGQTMMDLSSDVLLAQQFDVDMAAFGPFVRHPNTPLARVPSGDLALSLRVVAVARLILGPVHIPASTAFDAVAPDGRQRALCSGANVIMANLTPVRYNRLYDIYPDNRAQNSVARIKEILQRIERPMARDHGHSLKGPQATEARRERQGV